MSNTYDYIFGNPLKRIVKDYSPESYKDLQDSFDNADTWGAQLNNENNYIIPAQNGGIPIKIADNYNTIHTLNQNRDSQIASSFFAGSGSREAYAEDRLDQKLRDELLSKPNADMKDLIKSYGQEAKDKLYDNEYRNLLSSYSTSSDKDNFFNTDPNTGKYVNSAADRFNALFGRESGGNAYTEDFLHGLSAASNSINRVADDLNAKVVNTNYDMATHYTPRIPNDGNDLSIEPESDLQPESILGGRIDSLLALTDGNGAFTGFATHNLNSSGMNEGEIGLKTSIDNLLLASQLGTIRQEMGDFDIQNPVYSPDAMSHLKTIMPNADQTLLEGAYSKIATTDPENIYNLIERNINSSVDFKKSRFDTNSTTAKMAPNEVAGIINATTAAIPATAAEQDAVKNRFKQNSNHTSGNIYGMDSDKIDTITAKHLYNRGDIGDVTGEALVKGIFGDNVESNPDLEYATGQAWSRLGSLENWTKIASDSNNPMKQTALDILKANAGTSAADGSVYSNAYDKLGKNQSDMYDSLRKRVDRYNKAIETGNESAISAEEEQIQLLQQQIDLGEDAMAEAAQIGKVNTSTPDDVERGLKRGEIFDDLFSARVSREEQLKSSFQKLGDEWKIANHNTHSRNALDRRVAELKQKDIEGKQEKIQESYANVVKARSAQQGAPIDNVAPLAFNDLGHDPDFMASEAALYSESLARTSKLKKQRRKLGKSSASNQDEINRTDELMAGEVDIRNDISLRDGIKKEMDLQSSIDERSGATSVSELMSKYAKLIYGLKSIEHNELSANALDQIIYSGEKAKITQSLEDVKAEASDIYGIDLDNTPIDDSLIKGDLAQESAKEFNASLNTTRRYKSELSALSADPNADQKQIDFLKDQIKQERVKRQGIAQSGVLPIEAIKEITAQNNLENVIKNGSEGDTLKDFARLEYKKQAAQRSLGTGNFAQDAAANIIINKADEAMKKLSVNYEKTYGRTPAADFSLIADEIEISEAKDYEKYLKQSNSYQDIINKLTAQGGNDALIKSIEQKKALTDAALAKAQVSGKAKQDIEDQVKIDRRLRVGRKQDKIDEYATLQYKQDLALRKAISGATDADKQAAADSYQKISNDMADKARTFKADFDEDVASAVPQNTGSFKLSELNDYANSLNKAESLKDQIRKLNTTSGANADDIAILQKQLDIEQENMLNIAQGQYLDQSDIDQIRQINRTEQMMKYGGKSGMIDLYGDLSYKRQLADYRRSDTYLTQAERDAAQEQFEAISNEMSGYENKYNEAYGTDLATDAAGKISGKNKLTEKKAYTDSLNNIQSLKDTLDRISENPRASQDDLDYINGLIREEVSNQRRIKSRGILSQNDRDIIKTRTDMEYALKHGGKAGMQDSYAKLMYSRQVNARQATYGSALEQSLGGIKQREIDAKAQTMQSAYGRVYHGNIPTDYSNIADQMLSSDAKEFASSLETSRGIRSQIDALNRDPVGNAAEIQYLQNKLSRESARRSDIKNGNTVGQGVIDELEMEDSIKETLSNGGKSNVPKSKFGKDFTGLLKGSFQRYLSYGVVYKGIDNLVKSVSGLYNTIIQLNGAATELRIVTGKSSGEAHTLIRSYQKMGKELGTTTAVIAKSADEWLRQGYSISEANTLVESSIKLSKLGMIDSAKATSYLTSTLKGFKLEASDAISIVDKLTTLDMNYATSAGDIAEAMSRVASVANDSGMGLDATAAMLTTVMDITQQDSSMAGTALRSMLSRYGSINASDYAKSISGEDMEGVNDIEKVLSTIGITIRESSGSMRAFDDVLEDVAEKWINLTDVQKNAISTAMAGTRQRNAFVSLVSNYDQVKEAEELSKNSEGQANIKYDAYLESIAYQMERIKNAWEGVGLAFEDDETIVATLKAIAWIVQKTIPIVTSLVQIIAALNVRSLSSGVSNLGQYFGHPIQTLKGDLKGDKIKAFLKPGTQDDPRRQAFNEVKRTEKIAKKAEKKAQSTGKQKDAQNAKLSRRVANASKSDYDKKYGNKVTAKQAYKQAKAEYKQDRNNPSKLAAYRQAKTNYKSVKSTGSGFLLNKENLTNGALYGGISFISGLTAGNQSSASSIIGDIQKSSNTDTLGEDKTTLSDIKATTGDRLITGALMGIGGAAGAIFGGPIGAAVGAALGDLVATGIKYALHRDDMDRADRVKEYNRVVDKMNEIESSIQSTEDLFSKQSFTEYTSEDWSTLSTFIQQAKLGLMSTDTSTEIKGVTYTLSEVFQDNLSALGVSASSATDALNDLATNTSNAADALAVIEAYSGAQLKLKYAAEYGATLDERHEIDEKLEDGDYDEVKEYRKLIASGKEDEALELKNKYNSEHDDDEDNFDDVNKNYEALLARQQQIEYEYISGMLEVAMKTSGVAAYSASKAAETDVDTLIYKIAKQWKKEGNEDVFDANGQITSDARSDILTYIRQNDKLRLSLSSNKRFMGDYLAESTDKNRADVLAKYNSDHGTNITSFQSLVELAKGDNFIGDEDDRNRVLKLSTEKLTTFAHKLGMTTAEFTASGDEFESISEANLSGTLTELQEHFNSLSTVLKELTDRGSLSVELLDKVIETMPYLLKSTDENGNITVSQDNIAKNLIGFLAGGPAVNAYGRYAASQAREDDDRWKVFWNNYGGTDREKWQELFGNTLTDDELDLLSNSNTKFSQVQDIIYANDEVYKIWAENMTGLTATLDELKDLRSTIIKYEQKSLDNRITELESIKDNLNSVNEKREEELKLIKAKQQLENSINEKKKVYRAGIGWTYEADQTAVKEAQTAVDEAENEKESQNLQYQIDLLNQEKEILGNIESDESWEYTKEIYQSFNTELGLTGDAVSNIYEIFSSGKLTDAIGAAVYDGLMNLENIRAEEKKNDIEGVKTLAETAAKSREDYENVVKNNGSAEEVIKYYKIAVDKSKELYDEIIRVGNEYNLGIEDWGDFNVDLGSQNGTFSNQKIRNVWREITLYNNSNYTNYKIDSKYASALAAMPASESGESYALGTFDAIAGTALINELGTEAIVTPSGTLTALPAHTGIVPADLTRNLYDLGSIAPNLIQTIKPAGINSTNNNSRVEDNSMNVGEFNATFQVDNDFDFERLMEQARQYVATTKNRR